MRWPSTPVCATLALLAVLAGCGGGEDKPKRTATLQAGDPVRVLADEYSFDPARIVVTRGPGRSRVTLDNRGELAHDLKVLDGDRELGGLRSFPAGEQRSFTLTVPPGSYRLVCTVADHEELGMEGELELSD